MLNENFNVTSGVEVLNRRAVGYIPDCSTTGGVQVAFLPYNANSAGGRGKARGRKLGAGFLVLTVGITLLANL